VLTEPAGRRLLSEHALPVGRWVVAQDADEAARALDELAAPVALKVVSPDVVHKSDVGGVALDLATADAARSAYRDIVAAVRAAAPQARIEGVLITPMADPGVELIVGAATDPTFGPIVTLGAGGTSVEVLRDVTFRALPVTSLECREMLDELAIAPLLDGFRGGEPVDRERLVDLLLAVSRTVEHVPELVELDLNPVLARADGLDLVDVRVVVAAERYDVLSQ
jgi:acetate---CoA ligase (ADP-forming)